MIHKRRKRVFVMTYSYDRARTGRRIQARRMALELTQEQLAERMDCSLRFVADVERGAVGMSIDSLVRACATLHTSPDALLRDEETDEAEGGEAALMEALSNLPARRRETALDILRAYLRGE